MRSANDFHVEMVDSDASKLDVRNTYGPVFTLLCCVLFLPPAFSLLFMTRCTLLVPFDNMLCWFTLLIPLFIGLMHFVHVRKALHVVSMSVALLLPSVLLFVLAETQVVSADKLSKELSSSDCSSNSDKRRLQESWDIAFIAFERCANQTAITSEVPVRDIMSKFRIHDCDEYPTLLREQHQDWLYLENLEDSLHCTGICYPAQQLWSVKPWKDSCSVAVSSLFKLYVKPYCRQISVAMAIVMLCSFANLVIFWTSGRLK
eukprot:TRINITY_DN62169_c0_g1_i1.p1 TRINITY_DN62169_c0_g1~~TRINITY_DN62169_c0_g1_i1.p1  ORF type:complete len:260 (-),score=32.03 TRINITY_DN62169_c0_g1_i1:34-813(-)